MIWFYIIIFLISCFFLAFSSKWLVDALSKIAKFLGWKEFVVAFFLMAFGVSVPNFFVGIISALNKIPELSFGDVVGGNIVDLSLVIGLAALISRMGLSASSRTVQGSSIFTIGIAILPLILISDGVLSRPDGLLLLLAFFIYISWLFSKRERFQKLYDGIVEPMSFKFFFKNLIKFLISVIFLLLAAQGIVKSATFFASYLNLPIGLIGILVVGLVNSLPEGFFSIQAARKGQDWLVLGDLMGGVVITATLVLGIVALICPIQIHDFSPFVIARIFLIISALFFFFFVRTDRQITKKEALFLILIYVAFVLFALFWD
jgi:cation:H+ antiporter